MGYWAAGAALVGGLASVYSSSQAGKTKSSNPVDYNAYGQINQPIQGAITSRDSIYSALNGPVGAEGINAGQRYADALQRASQNPVYGSIQNYGQDLLNGRYLQSPVIKGYADQAAAGVTAGAADADARLRSQYARSGMGFSTAMNQASTANRAAAAAKAQQLRSGILANNYQFEQGLQQQAPSILDTSISTPLSYIGGGVGAVYSPYQTQAGLTTSLLGNQTVAQPTLLQQPNLGSEISAGLGSGLSLYSAFQGMNRNSSTPKTTATWNGTLGDPGTGTYYSAY